VESVKRSQQIPIHRWDREYQKGGVAKSEKKKTNARRGVCGVKERKAFKTGGGCQTGDPKRRNRRRSR